MNEYRTRVVSKTESANEVVSFLIIRNNNKFIRLRTLPSISCLHTLSNKLRVGVNERCINSETHHVSSHLSSINICLTTVLRRRKKRFTSRRLWKSDRADGNSITDPVQSVGFLSRKTLGLDMPGCCFLSFNFVFSEKSVKSIVGAHGERRGLPVALAAERRVTRLLRDNRSPALRLRRTICFPTPPLHPTCTFVGDVRTKCLGFIFHIRTPRGRIRRTVLPRRAHCFVDAPCPR